jgi:hypothetical protein
MGPKKERKNFFSPKTPTDLYAKETLVRPHLRHSAAEASARSLGQSALIRVASRDNFRETVFLWSTPLVIARCISGCASRRADSAVALSPVAIAVSTFFTKVRTRLTRPRLMAVRLAVCRMRFSADLWFAMQFAVTERGGLYRGLVRDVNSARGFPTLREWFEIRLNSRRSHRFRVLRWGGILLLAWCAETIWRIGWIEDDAELERRVITVRAGMAF